MSLRQVSEGAFFTSLQHSHTYFLTYFSPAAAPHPLPHSPETEEKSWRLQCSSSQTGGTSMSCLWLFWCCAQSRASWSGGAALQCRHTEPRAGSASSSASAALRHQHPGPTAKSGHEHCMDFLRNRERRIRINRNYYSVFMLYPFWYPLPPSISRRKVLRQYNFY